MKPEKVEWKTGDGRRVEFLVGWDWALDDDGRPRIGGEKELNVSATLDGKKVSAYELQDIENHATLAAKFGNIGITHENHKRLNVAIAQVETEIEPHNDDRIARAARLDAISDRSAAMARRMREGE